MIKILSVIWLKIAGFFRRKAKSKKNIPANTQTHYTYVSTDGSSVNLEDMVMPYRNRHTGSAYFQPAHSQKIKNKRRRAQFY